MVKVQEVTVRELNRESRATMMSEIKVKELNEIGGLQVRFFFQKFGDNVCATSRHPTNRIVLIILIFCFCIEMNQIGQMIER